MDISPTDRTQRDAALLNRLRNDDAQALGELVHCYAEWLVECATRILQSEDLAQDVVQEVFAWLWDARATLQIQSSLPAYLYRAMNNRAYNALTRERSRRRLSNRVAEEQSTIASHTENAAELALSGEDTRLTIDVALSQLQPRMRDVFLMRAERDMSYEEIAEAMGISVATVYKQMYRATKTLAESLDKLRGMI